MSHGTRLVAALESVDALPAHTRARELFIERASDSEASAAALASIAESDPAIAARLLRLANQAADSSSGPVVTTAAAIELLGRDRACTAITRLPHYALAADGQHWDDEVDRFRIHAIAVRATAATLARELGDPNPDRVATIALLHDIGKLVLARVHSGYPDSTIPAGEPDERAAEERRALGFDHAAIGGVVARRWGLPGVVSRAIEHHHGEDGTGDAAIVRLADMLVHRARGTRVSLVRLFDAARRLGLPEQRLAVLLEEGVTTECPAATERCPLTPRQLELIRALGEGRHNKEIAAELELSASTIRSHLSEAYRRLGVVDRAQAVLLAVDRGWIRGTRISGATA